MAVADDPSKSGEQPGGFYGLVTRFPWLFAVLMPLLCIVLLLAGFLTADTNKRIHSIWAETKGKYYDAETYSDDVTAVLSSSSTFLAIAKDRAGGNMFTSAKLQHIVDRMNEAEATTVTMKVGGTDQTFTYQDVCTNTDGDLPYYAPCVRVTPMDMWMEAANWDANAKAWWYDEGVAPAVIEGVILYTLAAGMASIENSNTTLHGTNVLSRCGHMAGYGLGKGMPFSHTGTIPQLAGFVNLGGDDACSSCYTYMQAVKATQVTNLMAGGFTEQAANEYLFVNAVSRILVSSLKGPDVTALLTNLVTLATDDPCVTNTTLTCNTCNTNENLTFTDIVDGTYRKYGSVNCKLALMSHVNSTGHSVPLHEYTDADGETVDLAGVGDLFGGAYDMGPSPTSLSATQFATLRATWDGTYPTAPDGTYGGYYKWAENFLTMYAGSYSTVKDDEKPGGAYNYTDIFPAWYAYPPNGDPWHINAQGQYQRQFNQGRAKFMDYPTYTYPPTGGVYGGDGKGGTPLAPQTAAGVDLDEAEVLKLGSGYIYGIDEGKYGAVSKHLTMGGTTPPVDEYQCQSYSRMKEDFGVYKFSMDDSNAACANPLTEVKGIQSLYLWRRPKYIMQRVANASRPGGAVTGMTEAEAEELLIKWKEAFTDAWTAGFDDSSQAVQYVGFADDAGGIGSFGQVLADLTTSSGPLTAISYGVLILFSAALMYGRERQHSRVVAGFFGALFSIVAFGGALGLTSLCGMQLQLVQTWTLPFLMVGIGVDDMYIITLAINKAHSTSAGTFVETMKEVFVPVTMTSLTNLGMFAIMAVTVAVPATYETAYTAMMAIGLLWSTMLTAYPAVMYLDLKRQERGATAPPAGTEDEISLEQGMFYSKIYKPMLTNKIFHCVVLLVALAFVGVSAYGLTDIPIGIGTKEFFEDGTREASYSKAQEELFPTWPASISWGNIDYTDPKSQLHMMKQLEAVASTSHVDASVSTDKLWIAKLALWGSTVCDDGPGKCGADFTAPGGNTCTSTWVPVTGDFAAYSGLRFSDYETPEDPPTKMTVNGVAVTNPKHLGQYGVCVTGKRLRGVMTSPTGSQCMSGLATANDDVKYCPVFAPSATTSYTDADFQYCMGKWRLENSGGSYNYKSYADDGITRTSDEPEMPIPVTTGPTMYAIGLTSHSKYVDFIKEVRAACDDDETAPWYTDSSVRAGCWVHGIPVDYWTQYLDIESFLIKLCVGAVFAGVVIAALFLAFDLIVGSNSNSESSVPTKLLAALSGGLLIGMTSGLSLLCVVGICCLAGVNLSVFSIMSYLMSVGYAVEFAVHIVHRFMTAPAEVGDAGARVEFAMDFLFLPCFMAFISSLAGIVVMGFAPAAFVVKYFFTPLIVCMVVTFFFGCVFLPVFLQYMSFGCCSVGASAKLSKRPSISKLASTDL